MNVFMTSATGHVGSAVADLLHEAGHRITALARSEERAEQLAARGILPLVGDLREPESYAAAAAEYEAILHTAYEYDADGSQRPETDESAVETLLAAATASPTTEHFVYTSSVFLLGGIQESPLDETVATSAALPASSRRLAVESRVLAASGERLATAVVRLGVVYGANNYSMAELFESARRHGHVHFYGAGAERWPLVYRGDVAALFQAVVEHRGTGIFHAVDGVPMTTARIAELASAAAGCGGRTRSLDAAAARELYGEHYDRVARDVPAVGTRASKLGWAPSIRSFEEGAAVAFREWKALQGEGAGS